MREITPSGELRQRAAGEVRPNECSELSRVGDGRPAREPLTHVHRGLSVDDRLAGMLLPMLGIPLGELFDLSALATDCATDGRYTCLFVSAPLNIPHGVATPPNALAIK